MTEIFFVGYTEFLSSLVNQEVSTLPRSVYNPRKHLQKRQNTDDALSKVPKVLCSQFEARRSLPLQRNLAGRYIILLHSIELKSLYSHLHHYCCLLIS